MDKILTSSFLNKKLSSEILRSKVGKIQINAGNINKSLSGANLRKFIIEKGRGKTDAQIERKLREYGVSGHQIRKRESIMKLIRGSEKKGLTPEQIKRNLKSSMQTDEPITRQVYKTKFAGNVVSTKSIGVADDKKEKGSMDRIGVNRGSIGFAGGTTNKVASGINFKY